MEPKLLFSKLQVRLMAAIIAALFSFFVIQGYGAVVMPFIYIPVLVLVRLFRIQNVVIGFILISIQTYFMVLLAFFLFNGLRKILREQDKKK